jgi:cytochrome P450
MTALQSPDPAAIDPAVTSRVDTAEVDRLTARRFAAARPHPVRREPVDFSALPPGPRWPSLLQTVGLIRFRHRFVPAMHRRYGDVFTVRLLPGRQPLVLFVRPEHAKEIFAGDPEVFHAGKGNAILGPIMGEHSLLLQDSAEHKRARKLLMPAFNGQALRGYADLVAEVAHAEVATWRGGEEFRSLDRMNRLTLDVILRVVFGVTDEARLGALRPRVNRTVEISPAILLGWSVPRLQRIPPWRGTVENQRELDRLIHAEIRERRQLAAGELAERGDVLSRLMLVGGGDTDEPTPSEPRRSEPRRSEPCLSESAPSERPLSDDELRDQLVTLLLAGHETTATALAWALFELGRHPELLARARWAADEGDDDFLDAVLKESMRLHPVIPMVVRTLMEPVRLAGREFPAGTTVGPSILLAHDREENHPAPDAFDPERFLGHNPPANTWLPFGGGVRRCIGAGFSLMEGVVILREVLASYDVAAVGQDGPKVRNITSVPQRGARIRVTAR